MLTDTIAAISTSLQEQAISVIRISGDEALEIASRLTHKDFSSDRHAYGDLYLYP